MVSAGNVTYTYNAQGLRVSKTSSGETNNFTLVGSDVWSDSESKYLRGIELIASDTQIYLYNIRGDVIQLLGFDGEVDKTYDYDAYGNEYSRDLADENPFRYCGEYYDTETGFIYLRARYYDPTVGRFTSQDTHWSPSNAIYGDNPVKTSSAEDCTSLYPDINAILQNANLYVYCGDNPINRIDHTGEYWQELWEYYLQLLRNATGYFAVAGATTQLDTPMPGPADILGVILAVGGAVVIGGVAVLTYQPVSISKPIYEVKAETKTQDISLPTQKKPVYFPLNPYDFNPRGLYRREFPGSDNGRIIKWFDPVTNIPIFEWNEDFKIGSHYHAMKIEWNGEHYGPHLPPGSLVEEPWRSLYF